MRSTRAIINLDAIQHNLSVIRRLAPGRKVMAVLKADAYGHGIVEVAQALIDADALAVACMDEAETLRAAGVKTPIVLLEGFFSQSELQRAEQLDLISVIHQQRQLQELLESDVRELPVWLKIDSGMNRLGFGTGQYQEAFKALQQCSKVKWLGLMSHLACADDIAHAMSQQQLRYFKRICGELDPLNKLSKSMANSAAILAWPEAHFDWVRPGLLLYGCTPLANKVGSQHGLKPVMNLESQLFAIRQLKAGESVGYGATWQAEQDTEIGIIAIGYGDGYPRHAKEGTPVWIKGNTYPLVGRVSMDMIAVNLGHAHNLRLGERVVLWGRELPVEVIAEHAQTIPYTLLCGVTSRVKMQWQQGEAANAKEAPNKQEQLNE